MAGEEGALSGGLGAKLKCPTPISRLRVEKIEGGLMVAGVVIAANCQIALPAFGFLFMLVGAVLTGLYPLLFSRVYLITVHCAPVYLRLSVNNIGITKDPWPLSTDFMKMFSRKVFNKPGRQRSPEIVRLYCEGSIGIVLLLVNVYDISSNKYIARTGLIYSVGTIIVFDNLHTWKHTWYIHERYDVKNCRLIHSSDCLN